MPLLTVFLLTAACLPVDWPGPPFGLDRSGSAALAAAAVAVPLTVAFALRTWVVVALRRDRGRRNEVGRRYVRLRNGLYFFNVGCAALAVLGLGWGATAQSYLAVERFGEPRLPPFAELAVPLPYFLVLFGLWVVYYDAERALHRASPYGDRERPFWSRAGYVLHHLRQALLLLLLPVGLFASQQGAARWWPETARTPWFAGLSLAAVPLIVLLMPLAVKPLLGLRPLPPGPTRDRLLSLGRRLRFRCADLLVWPTRGAVVNAMVLGLVPRARFVVFTDRMLDEMPPDQLDAVFGHEAGHARHGHIWYYAVFMVLSMAAMAGAMVYVESRFAGRLPVPEEYRSWLLLPPVGLTAAYVFAVFGFLSRRSERQADVFGAWAVSCGDPACGGHDAATMFAHGRWALCPTGLRTMAEALERVALLNGHEYPSGPVQAACAWLRAWQHWPIPRRASFLRGLIDHPARERRFQRGMTALRWGLLLALVAALAGFVELVGWEEFAEAL